MKLFVIITPLTLVNVFAVWMIVYGTVSKDHMAALGIIIGIPVLIGGLIFNVIFRLWCRKDIGRLWLFEGIFILIAAFVFQAVVISNRE